MKKIAKMAVGLTAVAMAASAFAGGPEMAAPSISGFNIGLGFGFKSYLYDQVQIDFTNPNLLANALPNQAGKFGPLGEIGYTFQLNNWAFIGLRAYWQYDRFRNQTAFGSYQGQTYLQSHLAAMFLAGLLLNGSNAAYLEVGYTALWGKVSLQAVNAPGQVTPASANYTLSGGIAGVGWRHYFMNNVYLDLSYDFALYSDSSTGVALPASLNGGANLSGVRKLHVNGITATLNYLFKM